VIPFAFSERLFEGTDVVTIQRQLRGVAALVGNIERENQ
jgi:hypothetical protein